MLKGDLSSTPIAPLLLQLATEEATGCLLITDPDGQEAQVFYKAGWVYAITVPGTRPQLGAKLVSSGELAPEALADALEAQRKELQGWRLGELLVHLEYVEQTVVEAFVKEQLHDSLWDLLRWLRGEWKFRKNVKTREDVAPPVPVAELLTTLRDRGDDWETISSVVHGPMAVPSLSARAGAAAESTLDSDAWSMLCKIDGERTVSELAREGGYTLFEAGLVLVDLVQAGLVDIEEDVDVASTQLYGAQTLSAAWSDEAAAATATPVAEPEPEDAMARLARLVSEVATGHPATEPEDAPVRRGATVELSRDEERPIPLHRTSESFAASLARVSAALSDALGPMPAPTDVSDVANRDLRAQRVRAAAAQRVADPEWERHERLRHAAAAELAEAHAMAEAERGQVPVEPTVADAAADAAEMERAAAERVEAERVEAERVEAERVEAERVEAERLAAEQAEAARLEAERVEAERLAAEQAEAARLEAERVEAERLAAEAAEAAERLAAEREAAETAAWGEYWQRQEAERVAAEAAAAARAEAEAAARAEAEAAAAAEAARRAEEEAERQIAAENERVRAEHEAAAKALLLELSNEPDATPEPEPEPDDEPTDAADDDDHDQPDPDAQPIAVGAVNGLPEYADTAALLRELASLGMEDERPSAPAVHRPNRSPSHAPNDKKKKKRGLFGL